MDNSSKHKVRWRRHKNICPILHMVNSIETKSSLQLIKWHLRRCTQSCILIFSFTLYLGCLSAQQSTPYHFQFIGKKDGLPSQIINALFQDRKGKIWIGTNSGLVSYNGYYFEHYSATQGLRSEVIEDITQDVYGNIWVAGNKGVSVVLLDTIISSTNLKSASQVECDTFGNIWTVSFGGIYKATAAEQSALIKNKQEFSLAKYKNNSRISGIHEISCDFFGHTYLISDSGVFKIVKGDSLLLLHDTKGKRYFDSHVFPISKDSILWSTQEGYIRSTTIDTSSFILDLQIDSLEGIYNSLNYGHDIYIILDYLILHLHDHVIDTISLPTEWNVVQTRCLLKDNRGNIWVGTSDGLALLKKRQFTITSVPEELTIAFTAEEDKDGNILVGLNKGMVGEFTGNKVKPFTPNKILPDGEIFDIGVDHQGGIWFVSYWRGVSRLIGDKLTRFFYGNYSQDYPDLFCFFEDVNKTVWIGAKDWVYKINMDWDSGIPNSIDKMPLEKGYCHKIVEDKGDNLWFGTTGGLYRLDEDSIVRTKIGEFPEDINIQDLIFVGEDLWIATYGFGVLHCHLDNSNKPVLLKTINSKDGLLNNYVDCLESDGHGYIWAGGLTGISRINSQEYTLQNYTQDGIEETPYIDISVLKKEDGSMLFTTSRNIFSFDPESFHKDSIKPICWFEEIKVNGNSIPLNLWNEHNKYDYNENSFEFKYIQYNPSDAKLIQYKHRLTGLNNDWSTPHSKREIRYDFLPPEDYSFEVLSRSATGVWSFTPLKFEFTIREAIWNRLWIQLLILSTCTILFALWLRSRVMKSIEEERKKMRIKHIITELETKSLRTQMNPHFVFNCLNAIQEQILTNQVDSAYDYLSKFSELLRLVMENSAAHDIRIIDEIKMLQIYLNLESLRFENAFEFSIDCDEEISYLVIPSLMIQPFVENAIWHGLLPKKHDTSLKIKFFLEGEIIIIIIEDNGIGRDSANSGSSNIAKGKRYHATNVVKERLNIINSLSRENATMQIIDLKNKSGKATGTKVIVKVPVNLLKLIQNVTKTD